MPYTYRGHTNAGAYTQPFSGVGITFDPLGTSPDRTGVILHETGYLPENTDWNYPSVFSPFWRLIHNAERGHCLLFGERVVELTPAHLPESHPGNPGRLPQTPRSATLTAWGKVAEQRCCDHHLGQRSRRR